MSEHNLDSLDPMKFTELIKKREAAVAAASDERKEQDYPVNRLAEMLHPKRQYLEVERIIRHADKCKTFVLKPDGKHGRTDCAYFSAGQYLCVQAEIEGKHYSRPYSIVSSPKEALSGRYAITVKAVNGGIVSNFILDNWNVGTTVITSAPEGNFTYEPLRDAGHIIGIAGGSGITPFLSLAKAIDEGSEECSLTLLYGSRTEKEILFKEELDSLQSEKIKVVYILSEEQRENYEHGYITAELIKKYAVHEPYSVFICGPQQMYRFVDMETDKLKLDEKYIRREVHGEIYNPEEFPDYPSNAPQTVQITVTVRGKTITINGGAKNTILRLLEQNGISPPSGCRSGECGFCRSRLISGKVFVPKEFDKRRQADEKYGYIHPCSTYPLSNLEIEVFPCWQR